MLYCISTNDLPTLFFSFLLRLRKYYMNILCGHYGKEETSLLFKTEEVISLPFFHSYCFAYNARSLSAYLIVNQYGLKPLKCKLFMYVVSINQEDIIRIIQNQAENTPWNIKTCYSYSVRANILQYITHKYILHSLAHNILYFFVLK